MASARRSAGLLLWRRRGGALEVLLVHPGGPVWARQDAGAWSIPKGLVGEGETPEDCARRELREETGARAEGALLALGEAHQRGGKLVLAFAAEGDFDPAALTSNSFELEWPPRSGRRRSFPEVDRAEWFAPEVARVKILAGQAVFLERLEAALRG